MNYRTKVLSIAQMADSMMYDFDDLAAEVSDTAQQFEKTDEEVEDDVNYILTH
mgnify:CR=1 FL=1